MPPIENSESNFEFGPYDRIIEAKKVQGQKTYEKQRYGRPQFSFPDISQDQVDRDRLLNVLMGAGAGVGATQGAASPLAALAMGLGGGIQSARTNQAQQQAARVTAAQQQQDLQSGEMKLNEQELDLTPLSAISPALVQKMERDYGIQLGDMTLGKAKQILPMVQTFVKSQDASRAFALSADLKREMANASPAMQALIEAALVLPPGMAKTLKTSELGALKDQGAKPLTAELLKLKENAQDGIASISTALDLYKTNPQMVKLLGTYKGFGADFFRIASPEAQEFARNVDKATDVITRIRTGAALNTQEQVFYNGLVTKITQSNGQNVKAMEELLSFYQKIDADISSGKRTSSLASLTSDPKKMAQLMKRLNIDPKTVDMSAFAPAPAKVYKQTATNPQTGQKIGLNEQGQWEAI